MKVVSFKAWITNNPGGSGYYVMEGTPEQFPGVPDDGVLCVKKFFDRFTGDVRHSQLLSGADYIIWWPGPDGIVLMNSNDPADDLKSRYPGCILKRGRNVTDEIMAVVDGEAMKATCKSCGD